MSNYKASMYIYHKKIHKASFYIQYVSEKWYEDCTLPLNENSGIKCTYTVYTVNL